MGELEAFYAIVVTVAVIFTAIAVIIATIINFLTKKPFLKIFIIAFSLIVAIAIIAIIYLSLHTP